jgi:trimethylguanosine synthase
MLQHEHADFQPLPDGDCGDGVTNPYPKTQVADKYWAQRRRLFSRFDDGIQLDKEGWFSVTPEAIANHIAKRVVEETSPQTSSEGIIVLDSFCGCGGNAIAFARRPEVSLVVCVDTDLSKLEMAAKNASVYNIDSEKLLFVHDNAILVLSMYSNGEKSAHQASSKSNAEEPTKLHGYSFKGPLPERLDCIFLSPPWGGSDYLTVGKRHFFLTHISIQGVDDSSATIDGEELLTMAQKAVQQVVYFLPRNLNGIAMGRSALQAGYVGTLELEKNVLNGKFKTITAYLGFSKEKTTSPSK